MSSTISIGIATASITAAKNAPTISAADADEDEDEGKQRDPEQRMELAERGPDRVGGADLLAEVGLVRRPCTSPR